MKMNSNLRIARTLVRIARMLIAFNRTELERQLASIGTIPREEVDDCLSILESMDARDQRAALFWMRKGSFSLVNDLEKFNDAMNLVDKQHLDFQQFESPFKVLERTDKSTVKIKSQSAKFSPSSEPTFSNPYDAGNGITIYQVDDNWDGMMAVRTAIDTSYGYKKNPWCLCSRGSGDELEDNYYEHWEENSSYPKRIAFRGGKPIAFCANSSPEIIWWDLNDHPSPWLPFGGKDDPSFQEEYNALPKVRELLKENTSEATDRMIAMMKEDDQVVVFLSMQPKLPRKVIEYIAENGEEYDFDDMLEFCKNIPQELILEWTKDERKCRDVIDNCTSIEKKTFAEILKNVDDADCFLVMLGKEWGGMGKSEVYANAALNKNEDNRIALAEKILKKGKTDEFKEAIETLSKDKSSRVRDKIKKI